MRTYLITISLALAVPLGATSPAFAQSASAQQPQQAAKPVKDPNEIVCEKQQEIGSRLASARVCKTRAEWAEERQQERQNIEKIQTLRDRSH